MDRKNDIVNTSKPLGGRQHPTGLSTLLQMIETKTELYNNWAISRALIGREPRSIYTDKSTDHGNDVMVAQFVFLFLARAIFRETSTEMDEKNCDCYCKKTNRQQFSIVCTLIDHRNDVKMFKTLQWNHSSAARGSTWVLNIWTSFLWSIRVQEYRPWKIVVLLLSRDKKGLSTDISELGFADSNFHIILYLNCVINLFEQFVTSF